jgi:6-phosphofructokinase 1
MPKSFISRDGFGITAQGRRYFEPLIMGEAYPPYKQGLPAYTTLRNIPVPKKLDAHFDV